MTERYAIQELKRMRTPYNREAIDMAIDALMKVGQMAQINEGLMERVMELEKEEEWQKR